MRSCYSTNDPRLVAFSCGRVAFLLNYSYTSCKQHQAGKNTLQVKVIQEQTTTPAMIPHLPTLNTLPTPLVLPVAAVDAIVPVEVAAEASAIDA